MSKTADILRLDRVADALAAGMMPEPVDAAAHAEALRRYRAGMDLYEAFGLVAESGQDARAALAMVMRNTAVREAARHWPVSGALHTALARYQATAWRRERQEQTCPQHRLGKPEEWLWRILREKDHVVSSRQIRSIVGGEVGV